MIIVTGATGFIGTYLVDQLVKDGVDVLATGRSKLGEAYYKERGIPFVHLDITKEEDLDKLPKKGVDAVVHLAALIPAAAKIHDAKEYMLVNAFRTYDLLERCKMNDIAKVIYTTSHFEVEKLWGSDTSITEEVCRKFEYKGDHALYIISKNAASDYVEHYRQEYGMTNIIFRLSGVYGYGRYESAFELFIRKAVKGEPIEIWGDYTVVRDTIYVRDVVSAIIAALNSKSVSGLYNLATGKGISLEEEVKGIVKVFCPKDNPLKLIYHPEKPNYLKSYVYDITKAKRELGWSPKYSYEEMLVDYKKEMESGKFKFLLEKRKEMHYK